MLNEPQMLKEENVEILKGSEDSRELKRTAVLFAASSAAEDHEMLGSFLSSADFLNRLDAAEAYQGTYVNLRLARVMKNLMDNRLTSVDKVLLQLISSSQFQSHVLRMQLEIRALSVIRPSPEEAIQYWDRLSTPESPLAYDVIAALCMNQSEPAMALLEKKFADSLHDIHEKKSWARELILPIRNDLPLLKASHHLVTEILPADLGPVLVEALFDYQPDEWYIECRPPEPPSRLLATNDARKIMKKIGEYSLENLPLTPKLEMAVKIGLKELEPEEKE